MHERAHLAALMQRTRRYWYDDGLWELATGIFFLALALFLALEAVTPRGSRLWLLFGLGGPVIFIGLPLAIYRLVNRVKARITYPRTGYVRYRAQHGRRARILRAAGLGAALGVLLSTSLQMGWEIQLPLLFGAVGAMAFALVGYSLGLRRFYVLAGWSALAGVVIARLPLSNLASGALFWLALGLGVSVSGLYTLRRYLSSAPKPREEAET